ncbi:hypothetical protein SERLA73DRAFT_105716 [Serpula lacrymans var. lacrymans S7.3]|uniref:BTB domain-containing protein n=2 Tax=Serpula lacrymans var. lacrymans TaxID=341189 RepID=F8PRL5_SERL3|nr:uncharacterized protein SERLADRAFT_360862 [Serpula lacrymans var. lacrymans S7.9]EGO01154.1 hypothetical protein SERLA73DRAFT_105716 [Serpula lacrymans var. lacrymans S7.3]EGO26807.1 hypothetical protein SERLADRAFT_360862 [Serpula lacrymans var. lacrymans S7.9]
MQDVMSIFLVDGVLFKVHRYFLQRESDVFRSMFSCPPTEEGPEGESDDKPIFLPEVTRLEFESLLNFFYNSLYGKPLDSLDEWISLLSISSRYSMDGIRERAIEEIEKSIPPMLPVSQIVLAKKHHVKTWLAPAYEALCTRKESLTVAEAEQLGLVTSILLAGAREKLFDKELCPKCRSRPTRCSKAELVREVFSL